MAAEVVRELLAKLGIQTDAKSFHDAEKKIEGIKERLGEFQNKYDTGHLGEIASKLSSVFSSFKAGPLGAAASAAALSTAFTYLGVKTAETAVKMDDSARRVGMDAVAFQELLHGAEATGTHLETVNMTLGRLSRSLFEAGEGNKTVVDSFKKLGINVKDAGGKIRPTEEILYELSDKFAAMPEGAERAGLAMRVLGRGGLEAVPWLSRGSHALKEFAGGAHKAGVIIDKETIKISREFGLAKHEFAETFEGLAIHIGKKALPSLTALTKGISNAVVKMQPFLQMVASHYFEQWSNALRLVALTVSPIAAVFDGITNSVKGLNSTMGASGPIISGIVAGFKMFLSPITSAYAALEDMFRFLSGKSSMLGMARAKDKLAFARGSRQQRTFNLSGEVEGEGVAPNEANPALERSIYSAPRQLGQGVGEMIKGIAGGRYWKTWLEGSKLSMGISTVEQAGANMPWAQPWRGMNPEEPLAGVPAALARPGSWEKPSDVKVSGNAKIDITIDATGVVHKTIDTALREAAETVHK